MSLIGDDDVTFSVRGTLQLNDRWEDDDCTDDSDAEMLNLLENEERPDHRVSIPPDSAAAAAVGAASTSMTSQNRMSSACNGRQSRAAAPQSSGLSWSSLPVREVQRQWSTPGPEAERDETLKCVISSTLFFVIICLLLVLIFVRNPSA